VGDGERGVDLLRRDEVSAMPRSLVSQLPIPDALLDLRRRLGAGFDGGGPAPCRLSPND